MEPINIQFSAHDFGGIIRRAGTSRLINLAIGTSRPRSVFIRNAQVDPKRNMILHVEFYAPNLREKLTVSIPVAEKAKPRRIQVSAPADQTVIEASPQQTEVAGGGAT